MKSPPKRGHGGVRKAVNRGAALLPSPECLERLSRPSGFVGNDPNGGFASLGTPGTTRTAVQPASELFENDERREIRKKLPVRPNGQWPFGAAAPV